MRTYIILITILFSCQLAFGQRTYEEAVELGDNAFESQNYDEAINYYFAAEAFDPSKGTLMKEKVNLVFARIKKLRDEAEAAKKAIEAEKARVDSFNNMYAKLIDDFAFAAYKSDKYKFNDIKNKKLPNLYLFTIGINNYQKIPKLNGCVNDVKTFVTAMSSQNKKIFNLKQNIMLLDSTATKKNILDELKKMTSKVSENDFIFFYFSGHGDKIDNEGYFFPIFGTKKDTNTAISGKEFYDCIKMVKSTIFFIGDVEKSSSFIAHTLNQSQSKANLFKLYSVTYKGIIYETKNSTLTSYAFQSAIEGQADFDKNSVIYFDELFHYIWLNATGTGRYPQSLLVTIPNEPSNFPIYQLGKKFNLPIVQLMPKSNVISKLNEKSRNDFNDWYEIMGTADSTVRDSAILNIIRKMKSTDGKKRNKKVDYSLLLKLVSHLSEGTRKNDIDLPSFEMVNLRLKKVPSNLINCNCFTTIHLTRSELKTLPQNFGELTNVVTLYLNGGKERKKQGGLRRRRSKFKNYLSDLPNSFVNLQKLEYLNLSNNKFAEFPEELLELRQLKTLELEGNKLSQVPDDIDKMKSLEHLNLANNQLQTLPNSIEQLKKLKTLKLEGNSFSDAEKAKIQMLLPDCDVSFKGLRN